MHAATIMVALFVLQPVLLAVLPLGMGHLLVLRIAVSLLLCMFTFTSPELTPLGPFCKEAFHCISG
jgi:hypothetical protein